MNKEVVKKMIQIEKLRYEVLKDILPEKALQKLNNFEKEAFSLIKEIVLELMEEEHLEKTEEEVKKEVKKVKVNFL
jgi:hypothetical protein